MPRTLRLALVIAVAGSPCVALMGCAEESPMAAAPPPVAAGKKDPGPPTAFPVKPPSKSAKRR